MRIFSRKGKNREQDATIAGANTIARKEPAIRRLCIPTSLPPEVLGSYPTFASVGRGRLADVQLRSNRRANGEPPPHV
jgi:hypothetical protein